MTQRTRLKDPSMPRSLAAVSLLGAAAIHFVVARQHLHEWFVAGAFFAILGLVQAVGAGAVLSARLARSSTIRLLLTTLTVGTIALWAVSRTAGLPFGPQARMPEPMGRGRDGR